MGAKNPKQPKEVNIWGLTSEVMLPAYLKGWVSYWLRQQSFWTIKEIKEMSGSWRSSRVLHSLPSKLGGWSRNVIIEKFSCLQCWEDLCKGWAMDKTRWMKDKEAVSHCGAYLCRKNSCYSDQATHPTEGRPAATRLLLTSLFSCRQRAGTSQLIFYARWGKTD